MLLEIVSGKAAAHAILNKVKADAAVGELVVDDLKMLKFEWDEGYMVAFLIQELAKLAAANI